MKQGTGAVLDDVFAGLTPAETHDPLASFAAGSAPRLVLAAAVAAHWVGESFDRGDVGARLSEVVWFACRPGPSWRSTPTGLNGKAKMSQAELANLLPAVVAATASPVGLAARDGRDELARIIVRGVEA